MFDKVFLSAGLVVALTEQAAALSPIPSHQSAPPRIAEPAALLVAAPVAVAPPYCPLIEPAVVEPVIEQGGAHVWWVHVPDVALPPIQTTPIQ